MTEGRDPSAVRRRVAVGAGFTLIELLAAMTILLIIVMIVAQLFQQARVMWDTGMRRSEMNMEGRAVADFMAQELSMAVRGSNYPNFSATGASAEFHMLGDATNSTRAVRTVRYEFDGSAATKKLTRNGDSMLEDTSTDGHPFMEKLKFSTEPDPSGDPNVLPLFVDVIVTVSDGGSPASTKVYESRAVMINRKRYSMD
jgi:prepilin-type N-terminal cleavage/methylation domain-containing protein